MNEYEVETRKERKAADFVAWVAAGLAVLVLVAVFWPVHSSHKPVHRSPAISKTKQAALGMIMYAADWDERLPMTNDWEDKLVKYLKTKDIAELTVPPGKPPHRLAFNTGVSRSDTSTMDNAADTVLFFETDSTRKHSVGGPGLVAEFPGAQQSVIGFVDGHVMFKGSAAIAGLIWKPTFLTPPKQSGQKGKQPEAK